ncbi:MAG: dTDP-4-dehydrorhamnose reductase [Betaproteobacteria bacterium]
MIPRILLTGKDGQVGFELQRALAPLGEVIAVDRADCDLADAADIRHLMRRVRPQIVVNPAAYTAVDKAESEQDIAAAINAVAPGVLGEEAVGLGAWVVHYSTDYVFDGAQVEPYRETDAPRPLNIYGASKLAGERALQESGARHVILRTSWVMGAHGSNFVKTILRLAAERESLSVVADQFGAPTSAALLADVTAQLIGRAGREGADDFPFGLYHVTASGETSWHDYACHVVDYAERMGRPLKLQSRDIRPVSTAEYSLPAPRPANSRLSTEKFQQTFGLTLPDWRSGLDHILMQIV